MAYAVPGPRRRPGVVTMAAVVLFLLVAVRLAAAFALGHAIARDIGRFAVDLRSSSAPLALETDIWLGTVGLVILQVMAVYAPLAALVLRGNETARILTWTFACIEIIYDLYELNGQVGIPTWETRAMDIAARATLAGQIISVALLALPPANRYFRTPPALAALAPGHRPPKPPSARRPVIPPPDQT
jgi:hypothetical protein